MGAFEDIGSFIGDTANTLYDDFSGKSTDRRAHEESLFQYKLDAEQFAREQQYNSPEQQMNRLKKAGLNPRLIYDQGSGGAAGNVSASTPTYDKADVKSRGSAQAFANMMNLVQIVAKTKQTLAQGMTIKQALPFVGRTRKAEMERKQNIAYAEPYVTSSKQLKASLDFQSLPKKLTMMDQQISINESKKIFEKYRAYFMSIGVTDSSNPLIRGIASVIQQLGLTGNIEGWTDSILEHYGK